MLIHCLLAYTVYAHSCSMFIYQVSLTTFNTCGQKENCKHLLQNKTRQRLEDELYSLIHYWSAKSSFQHIVTRLTIVTNPHSRFLRCSYCDAILFESCSLKESDPLQFISTESLPYSNGSNILTCIWTIPNKTSTGVLIYFIHRLVNKRQDTLETNSIISRKLYGRENKLAKYDVTNTYGFISTPARPFLVCFREALGNRRFFASGFCFMLV